VFNDPTLDELICYSYKQNLTLREAGFRVLEARAQLGVAVGNFFPQTQNMVGSYKSTSLSSENASSFVKVRSFGQWNQGFNLLWEVDVWGRLRRAIESASDLVDASVEDYDAVLVTLLGDVATAYVNMRVAEQRIKYAEANAALQRATVERLQSRVKAKLSNEIALNQAQSLLAQTEATIPVFQITARVSANQLCVLLGIPPEDLESKMKASPIPSAPESVGVGIPRDLLQKRPDVRRDERRAAAQSEQIGFAEADFYPMFTIGGNAFWSAQFFKNMFKVLAFNGTFGPAFQWNILNSGRILNNVRLQKARFQEFVTIYQQTVLNAELEVENGLVLFLKSQEQTKQQAKSVEYQQLAEKTVRSQLAAGVINEAQLILIEQNLVQQQDQLAVAQGEIALGLIQVYRALGGGWQIRLTGCDPPPTLAAPAAQQPQQPQRPQQQPEPISPPRALFGEPK
jgi:NodT family efflux transporter outer membrane factor (OMF) lipoprotein